MIKDFFKKVLATTLTAVMLCATAMPVSAAETAYDAANVETVVFTNYNTAAITQNGDLYIWGNNNYGQLGDGTNKAKYLPMKVMSNVERVQLCEEYCGAITKNGDLYMWGDNSYGNLGNGLSIYENEYIPYKILSNVVDFQLGGSYNAALTKDGGLYTWGYNSYGRLGNGTEDGSYVPKKILSNVSEFMLASTYAGAITKNGDLYMWGANNNGQLGNGTTIRQLKPVKVMSSVQSVQLNNYEYTAAVKKNGDLYMWGANSYGQIGNNSTSGLSETKPVKVLENVKTVELSRERTAAITMDGDLYCWGWNFEGQVGDGTDRGMFGFAERYSPIKVLSDVNSVKLSSGNTAAVTTDGLLYIWGDNMYGQIGDGTGSFGNSEVNSPVMVMSGVKAFDIGTYNSSALTEDGSLYVWGENTFGQIGNGTVDKEQFTPVKVLEDVACYELSKDSWNFHNIAVREDGSLYTWGANLFGAIGNGTNVKQLTPVKVLGGAKLPDVEISIRNPKIERIYGKTRYETSYGIADRLNVEIEGEQFETVIVVNGKNFPDALAGSYLASVKNAPILMASEKNVDSLQQYIREHLQLGGTIYVLGGTGAIADEVIAGLEVDYIVNRLAGANRYDTNLLILEEAGVTDEDILVCTGKAFADSLSASATGKPILLVNNKEITADQQAFLEAHTGNNYYIIGGEGAVNAEMEEVVQNYGSTERIYGANRQETSVRVAEAFFENLECVVLAYAKNFPDGLCGGPLAEKLNAPLILTSTEKTDVAEAYVGGNEIEAGIVLGGESLISNGAVNVIFKDEVLK